MRTRFGVSGDLAAGSIVAVLLIPQSIAYATLAGVPPVLGLYAAALPLLVYLLLGTSKHLSVGPVSIVSLLAFTSVSALAEPYSVRYIELVSSLAQIIGVLLLIMGLLQIGLLLDRVSPAVIHGFTSAAAIIICLQQLGPITGIELPREEQITPLLLAFTRQLAQLHPFTLGLGLLSLITLYILQKLLPNSIGPLVVITLSACAVKRFELHRSGVDIVGLIPKGLPEIVWAAPSPDTVMSLFPTALAIVFIAFFESYAVAASIADKAQYTLRANRELIGLGAANVVSSLVGSVPVAGAFSRTAVNFESGGRTKLSSIVTVLLLIITLQYFTLFFYYIPKSALAAVIVFSVARMIRLRDLLLFQGVTPMKYVIALATFAATLCIGVAQGLLIGLFLSLVLPRLYLKNNQE